jgi:hypothetical protein
MELLRAQCGRRRVGRIGAQSAGAQAGAEERLSVQESGFRRQPIFNSSSWIEPQPARDTLHSVSVRNIHWRCCFSFARPKAPQVTS